MTTESQKQFPSTLAAVFFAVVFMSASFLYADDAVPAEKQKTSRPVPAADPYQAQKPKVETVADTLEYLKQENKVVAKGNVVITYGDEKITADYAEVETETKKAYARGHVIIFSHDKAVAKGEEVYYDFNNESGSFPQGTILAYPWNCQAKEINKLNATTTEAVNSSFTTCRGENPPYEVHAKKVTIHQEDKMVARNVTIYSLGKPIFWWPYLVIPLQRRNPPFNVSAGYNSEDGAYIETSKGFSITKDVYGKFHFDWRAKRGFATGADLNYSFERLGQGVVRGYWTQDERAPTPGLENPYSEREDRDRGRLSWWHRTDLDPYSHIQLRYHRLADEYFLQDFFEKEHRAEVEPQSFVTLTKNSDKYGLLVHATKKMNNFESTIERLPEVRFNLRNQPMLRDGLYFESETSYVNLAKRLSRSDKNEDVNRFDHWNEWTYPVKLKDFQVTPYLNARGTYYSRERESDNDHFRMVAGAGVDVRNQYYKTLETTFDKWGVEVNRLRHVFEPVVSYSAVRSTVSDEKLTRFDHLDTIDDEDVISFGMENRLQTKRVIKGRMQRVDIVSYNTFLSFSPNPHNVERGASFVNLDQELTLRPYDWLQYQIRTEYSFLKSDVTLFNQDLLIRATDRLYFIFGHRYIADIEEEEIDGSTQFVFDVSYKLNKLWTLGGYLRWQAQGAELDEWQVMATRDMYCLLFDFGYNVRNSDINSNNKELFFQLRMKDYPQINLKSGSRSSFSAPRIGETVAGANESTRYSSAQEAAAATYGRY